MNLFLFTQAQLDDIYISEGSNSLHWRRFVRAGLWLVTEKTRTNTFKMPRNTHEKVVVEEESTFVPGLQPQQTHAAPLLFDRPIIQAHEDYLSVSKD